MAFRLLKGLHEFRPLSFGLCNSMETSMHGARPFQLYCALIYNRNSRENFADLSGYFGHPPEAGLTLNLKECWSTSLNKLSRQVEWHFPKTGRVQFLMDDGMIHLENRAAAQTHTELRTTQLQGDCTTFCVGN